MIQPYADQLPPFFMNSAPKSGTNLIIQILLGMPKVQLHPQFAFFEGFPADGGVNFKKLSQIKPNQFVFGHVYYSPEWADMLRKLKMKHLFISRDLRDIVVSYTYYVVMKYAHHPMYSELVRLKTFKERFLLFINGMNTPALKYPNIAEWHMRFHPWINHPEVFYLTFEELMSSRELRRRTINRIVDYLWEGYTPPVSNSEMARLMEANIDSTQSATFRSGKIGSWKTEFDEEVKTVFKQVAGPILIRTGYEKNNDW
ncbi:MAG TPA: sulfotransferase domain-containing protein [Bacilli bacterium]